MRTLLKAVSMCAIMVLVTMAIGMGSKEAKEQSAAHEIKQGISGRVEIWEGNFMPMMDRKSSRNQIKPAAERRVRVHQAYKPATASANVDSVETAMIAETMTDDSGRFSFKLDPGVYSVFVEENDGWYNNGWNGEGIQGAVTVSPDKMTETIIKITSKATF